MSREYNESYCWTIEKFSFFHNYFAIIDTADYLADQLFIKHQVGYPDYLTFCADLKKNVQTVRDNGGVLTNETDDTTQEAEQESAKGATCEAAR